MRAVRLVILSGQACHPERSEGSLCLANQILRFTQDDKHDAKDVKHDAKDVKHDAKDVKHDVKDVKHDAKDVKHDAKDVKPYLQMPTLLVTFLTHLRLYE